MKTIAELKELFGLAKKPAILDTDGVTVLVPERLVDIGGYKFYYLEIASLALEEGTNPLEYIFRPPPVIAPVTPPPEDTTQPPTDVVPVPTIVIPVSNKLESNRMAVCDSEYLYVATMGDYPEGTLMVE